MTEKGKAKRLLTDFILKIAGEKFDDVVTNAEKLARIMWDKALGKGDPIVKAGKIYRPNPDSDMIKLIYERVEGRIATTEEKSRDVGDNIPDKISQSGKDRINSLKST